MRQNPVSVVILTRNEEKGIRDCLDALSWADEILVIDDYSKDKTLEYVEKLESKRITILKRALNNNFSAQRNFGLEKVEGDWVLFVDADEIVSEDLKNEIADLIATHGREQKLNGYFIKRKDFMWGKELRYGETGDTKLLRLAKRNSGRWEGNIHEKWKVKGNVGILKNPLFHYPHRTVAGFLKEINFYTDIRAKELYTRRVRASFLYIVSYPLGKFLLNFFLRRGFLDGIQGLIVAMLMSLHSFLVRAKLWLLWQKNK